MGGVVWYYIWNIGLFLMNLASLIITTIYATMFRRLYHAFKSGELVPSRKKQRILSVRISKKRPANRRKESKRGAWREETVVSKSSSVGSSSLVCSEDFYEPGRWRPNVKGSRQRPKVLSYTQDLGEKEYSSCIEVLPDENKLPVDKEAADGHYESISGEPDSSTLAVHKPPLENVKVEDLYDNLSLPRKENAKYSELEATNTSGYMAMNVVAPKGSLEKDVQEKCDRLQAMGTTDNVNTVNKQYIEKGE